MAWGVQLATMLGRIDGARFVDVFVQVTLVGLGLLAVVLAVVHRLDVRRDNGET